MTNNRLIAQSTLISKGWTKSMIVKFLPDPKLVPNPHYKCAAPMKLYEEDEVSSIMDTDEFLIAFEKAKKRKESAQKAVKTKTDILSKKMSETGKSINIKVIADEELVEIVLKIKKGEIRERLKKHLDYLDRRINDYDRYASYGNDNGDDIGDAYEDALEEEYERTKQHLKEFEFHRPNESTLSR